jgi:hypothetical protein
LYYRAERRNLTRRALSSSSLHPLEAGCLCANITLSPHLSRLEELNLPFCTPNGC